MTRRIFPPLVALGAISVIGLSGAHAQSKDSEEEMTFDVEDVEDSKPPAQAEPDLPPDPGDLDPSLSLDGNDKTQKKPVKGDAKLGKRRASWQDIVVVVRKPFLKQGRLELLPMYGVTMNDNLIQHHMFGGSVNYHLTDVLAVGIEGQYFLYRFREPFDLVARQFRRLPSVNEYKYGASLNFHYVPIYGKFAVLDEHIIHWESFVSAGVGMTRSQVIPRNPALPAFDNLLLTPNAGLSMRFFLTRFLTVHIGIRDYLLFDRLEDTNRMAPSPADEARDQADTAVVNNIMFQAGVSFWFPMSFQYTTFR